MVVNSSPAVEVMTMKSLPIHESKYDVAKSMMVVAGSSMASNASPADERMDKREEPIRETEHSRKKPSVVVTCKCSPIVEGMVTTSLPIQEARYDPSKSVMVGASPSLPAYTTRHTLC